MNKTLTFLFGAMVLMLGFPASAQTHKGLTFQGIVTDSGGTPLNLTNIPVNIKVLSPNGCILMEETHSAVNIQGGYLNLVVGQGSRAGSDRAFTFQQIFSNLSARSSLDSVLGAVGSCNYTPTASDSRKVRIYFLDGSDPVVADFNIRGSAFSVWAENSERLSGKTSAEFVQTTTDVTQARTNALYTPAVYDNLINLNSTSTGAVSLPSGTTAQQPSTATAGMIRYNNQGNQVEFYNGTAWTTLYSGTGVVTAASNVGTAGVGIYKDKATSTINFKKINAGSNLITVTDDTANNEVDITVNSANLSIASTQVTGLGDSATKNVGSAAGTVAAGDDSRITGALQKSGGSMTGALSLGTSQFQLGNLSADPTTSGWGASDKGKTWFNTTSNSIKYWDGTAIQALGSGSSGITSFNGSSVSTHTLSTPGTSGTAPAWTTTAATGAHRLDIPMASATSVTAGLLSKTDYDSFAAKLGTSTAFSGDVSGAYNATSVDKIKGVGLTMTTLTSGQFLKYNGTAWVNSGVAAGDIASGVLPVGNGGTGASTFTANKIVGTNSSGNALTSFSCSVGEVIKFDASGYAVCGTDNSASTTSLFANGGNSFSATATIGTNDANDFAFETGGTTKMTLKSDGKLGVGLSDPSAKVEVQGQVVSREYIVASGATVDFANGNAQILQSIGGAAITLNNMVNGGQYTIVVEDTTSRTYSFTNCSTTRAVPALSATSGRSVFTILKMSTGCYVSWITGF